MFVQIKVFASLMYVYFAFIFIYIVQFVIISSKSIMLTPPPHTGMMPRPPTDYPQNGEKSNGAEAPGKAHPQPHTYPPQHPGMNGYAAGMNRMMEYPPYSHSAQGYGYESPYPQYPHPQQGNLYTAPRVHVFRNHHVPLLGTSGPPSKPLPPQNGTPGVLYNYVI